MAFPSRSPVPDGLVVPTTTPGATTPDTSGSRSKRRRRQPPAIVDTSQSSQPALAIDAIQNLPDELLLEIFVCVVWGIGNATTCQGFLHPAVEVNHRQLLDISLVCRRWRRIASGRPMAIRNNSSHILLASTELAVRSPPWYVYDMLSSSPVGLAGTIIHNIHLQLPYKWPQILASPGHLPLLFDTITAARCALTISSETTIFPNFSLPPSAPLLRTFTARNVLLSSSQSRAEAENAWSMLSMEDDFSVTVRRLATYPDLQELTLENIRSLRGINLPFAPVTLPALNAVRLVALPAFCIQRFLDKMDMPNVHTLRIEAVPRMLSGTFTFPSPSLQSVKTFFYSCKDKDTRFGEESLVCCLERMPELADLTVANMNLLGLEDLPGEDDVPGPFFRHILRNDASEGSAHPNLQKITFHSCGLRFGNIECVAKEYRYKVASATGLSSISIINCRLPWDRKVGVRHLGAMLERYIVNVEIRHAVETLHLSHYEPLLARRAIRDTTDGSDEAFYFLPIPSNNCIIPLNIAKKATSAIPPSLVTGNITVVIA